MLRLISSVCLLAVIAACGPADTPSDAATLQQEGPVLSYTDAFVMEPIAGRDMTMGGVTLSVEGGDVELIGATSDAFEAIELHTMSMVDDKMQMRQVEVFEIVEGTDLELKRGGNHLMMFGIDEAVTAGETVEIALDFGTEDGDMTLIIEAEVKAIGG
ncbi:MAG: copper chaperone PCu(A)C [Pseudomonadota bacterium]